MTNNTTIENFIEVKSLLGRNLKPSNFLKQKIYKKIAIENSAINNKNNDTSRVRQRRVMDGDNVIIIEITDAIKEQLRFSYYK